MNAKIYVAKTVLWLVDVSDKIRAEEELRRLNALLASVESSGIRYIYFGVLFGKPAGDSTDDQEDQQTGDSHRSALACTSAHRKFLTILL